MNPWMCSVFLGWLAGVGPVFAGEGLDARIGEGTVRGVHHGDHVAFLGIRYAAPPTRFQPPKPPPAPAAMRMADDFGPACVQPGIPIFGDGKGEEDCLFLNVYRPDRPGPHPVMVWIHGGGFVHGSAAPYGPQSLVQHDVVLVTINYRLGLLGWMAHPALAGESGGSGNYGLMDQQAALRWVRDHIEGFGGDPNNVTIFGESAGGASVLAHLASPASKGLFHRAIAQSGSFSPNSPTLAQAEERGIESARKLGCDGDEVRECLRTVSLQRIRRAQRGLMIPNQHPALMPRSLEEAIAMQEHNDVPLMIGDNLDEFRLFVAVQRVARQRRVRQRDMPDTIDELLGVFDVYAAAPEAVQAVYAEGDYGDDRDSLTRMVSDIGTHAIWSCPTFGLVSALAAARRTYVYRFDRRSGPSLLSLARVRMRMELGAAHASELVYLFPLGARHERILDEPTRALSDTMTRYWTNFARNGIPDGDELLGWPDASEGAMVLNAPESRITSWQALGQDAHCDWWWDHRADEEDSPHVGAARAPDGPSGR